MTETTKLDNSTYNILLTLTRKLNFCIQLDTYVEYAKKDNRPHLVEIWNEMKTDKQNHLEMLREALEKKTKEEKLGN
ncbi:MAG: hypothetical protein WBE34_16390 [Candidatus Nitrosopolaris sp.]